MSLDKIREKLAALNEKTQKSSTTSQNNLNWKPGQRKTDKGEILSDVIRILPNKFTDPDCPILEIPIYWPNKFGKTWVSPTFFGEHDPIIEYCNELFQGFVDKEEYKVKKSLQKKLMPDMRYFALILDRSNESDGPKWWSFGIEVYKQILSIMSDEDYGNITDKYSGRDLTVTFTPAATDSDRPKTTILAKPKETVATTDKELLDKIENIPNVAERFIKPDAKELVEALEKFTTVQPNTTGQSIKPDHTATNQGFDMPKRAEKVDMIDTSDLDALFDGLTN